MPRLARPRQLRTLLPTLTIAAVAAVFAAAGLATPRADAAGLLVADGGFGGVLEIRDHDVDVTINNGVAVTTVDQTFLNTEQRTVEALYTFPVPAGASVANFSMWINGQEMVGEVVEKERARQIYETYKQQPRPKDPGLLEQTDYKTFEMRIFPIPAGAEQRVRVTYYQELQPDHDWATYVYPLATVATASGRTDLDQRATGRFALRMQVKNEIPIVEMTSPSHGQDFAIADHSEFFHEASLETDGGDLSRDVVLAYRATRPKTGIDLVTSKPQGEDGYFLLTLTAGEELAQLDQGMDYVFVLDVSGSMANDGKLNLSRRSIDAFVDVLGPDDRFEVMTFNVKPTPLFGQLAAADDAGKGRATEFLRSQQARGGTILAPAMTTAYRYADAGGDRPLVVVILSDGMTEQGERQELLQLISQRPQNARVFAVGVGNEVNRALLSQMAEDAGGLAAFVSQGDDFDRQAQAFRRKLTRPVATDVAIRVDGVEVYDTEPQKLANLYHGAPLRLYGRYKDGGDAKVTLTGNVLGREITQSVDVELPERQADRDANPEIERMWAWHKVDRLLKEADRVGSRDSVIDEIVRLGEGYSIVTEYTSFIVLENDGEYRRWKIDRKNATRLERDRTAQAALREQLDQLRRDAAARLGPAAPTSTQQIAQAVDPNQPLAQAPQQPATPPSQRGWDINVGGNSNRGGGGGGGAIDPVMGFVMLALAVIALAWTAGRATQRTPMAPSAAK